MFVRTIRACRQIDSPRLSVLTAIMLCGTSFNAAVGQIADGLTPQRANELRQYDFLQRTRMNDQRVDRQVEVARLEGRILRLEEQLRGLPHPTSTAQLAMVLTLLDEPRAAIAGEALPGDQSPSAQPPGQAKSASPTSVDGTTAAETPPEALAQASAKARQTLVRGLVGRDYFASLEVDIVDAKVDLLRLAGELTSLQRLSAKGLASSGQLELASLKRKRAELQLKRLEQQRSGIQQLFPQFATATPVKSAAVPAEAPAELPPPDVVPNKNSAQDN